MFVCVDVGWGGCSRDAYPGGAGAVAAAKKAAAESGRVRCVCLGGGGAVAWLLVQVWQG